MYKFDRVILWWHLIDSICLMYNLLICHHMHLAYYHYIIGMHVYTSMLQSLIYSVKVMCIQEGFG